LSQLDPERNAPIRQHFIRIEEANDFFGGVAICIHDSCHILMSHRYNGFCATDGATAATKLQKPKPSLFVGIFHDELFVFAVFLLWLIYELFL
jgi:hypothetical protein